MLRYCNTNFLNYTIDAINEVKLLNNLGIKVNFDLGTVIYNEEDIMNYDAKYINHIHISEPYLKPIELKKVHRDLKEWIKKNKYDNYVSIEMGNCNDIETVKKLLNKISDLEIKISLLTKRVAYLEENGVVNPDKPDKPDTPISIGLLLEDGTSLLLEDGTTLLLEEEKSEGSSNVINGILLEDKTNILLEDKTPLLLE